MHIPWRGSLIVSLLISLFAGAFVSRAEPTVDAKDLPRLKPTEPADVMKTITVRPGFHAELVASEPLVVSPVAISFDENGRMFVAEMIDYSEMRDQRPHGGRIRMLEDTNGDGKFDKSTIYADDLPWPTGVFCYGGGVFVAASPDIIYFKDTRGDGKADVRKVVFTGFGADKERLNVQALLNCFNWGLDNRIHGATGPNGGSHVTTVGVAGAKPLNLNGRDFYFDPRTFELFAENGGGQYGLSYDTHGRKFVCSNSHHIQVIMYDARYGARNPYYLMPPALTDIPADGPAAEVYRTSPDEAWRVIRTKWRVAGTVPGPIEGGGRPSGYFTGATGLTIYRGNAWPAENLNDAFIGDAGSNLVHRKKVHQHGVDLIAERAPDEQKSEFLACSDNWFRPVLFANAPDGTLYVIDMYREVIEHPWSLPESIKKYLDLNSGNDRGRIYRLVPDGFKQPKLPRLGKATTAELVATLENPNGWHRETAARLLYERQDKSAVPLLTKLVERSKSSLGRLHALYALDGLNALAEPLVIHGLKDSDPWVRTHAVKLSEKFFKEGTASAALWAALRPLGSDADANVRYQLAFTLGELKGADRLQPLAAIARRDTDSKWIEAAVLSSLAEGTGELFAQLAQDDKFRASAGGQDFFRQLTATIGAKNKPAEVTQVLSFLASVNDPVFSFVLVRSLGEGLQRAGGSLARVDTAGNLKTIFARAHAMASDAATAETVRTQAIQLLGQTSFAESGSELAALLDLKQSQAVQLAALGALDRFAVPQVPEALLKGWNTFTPRVRSEALSVLMKRPDRAVALLKAIEAGSVRASDLASTQIRLLQNHRDKNVKQLAAKVFADVAAPRRQDVIDTFMPALNLKGDAAKGKEIYQTRCISCHRLGGQGFAVGPDLVTVKTTGKEKMLVNIIDPNREVAPNYVTYLVDTKDGESLSGLVVNETSTSVTVRMAFGMESVVPRSKIAKMQSQGQSLMPEGIEAGLTAQDLANLLEYISTADDK